MTKCTFCQKDYKGYLVILCNKIECFVLEMELKSLYYNETEGICEECRKAKFKDNIFMIRLWFQAKLNMMLALSRVEARKDKKLTKDYKEALKRIETEQKKLEATPEVIALYKKNNPAAYMTVGTKKKPCVYCDENHGQVWINNPNGYENREDKDKCWWICIPCEKIIRRQSDLGDAEGVKYFLEKQHLPTTEMDNKINKIQKEIDDIAYEDGSETFNIKIKKI